MTPNDRLSRAALRLSASDPAFVGYWLDRYKAHERLDDAALAACLGLPESRLAALALCRTQAGDAFVDDLHAIAAFSTVDRGALASLLRQEQSLDAWGSPESSSTASRPAGWLLAAHDADQPPPDGDEDSSDDRGMG